jgi:hypothetical protein
MAANNESSGKKDEQKNKRTPKGDLSIGEVIDLITAREWNLLTDLYFCRCMPQSTAINIYFLDTTQFHYPEYTLATNEVRNELDIKNQKRAIIATRRTIKRLKDRGLIESSNFNPDSSNLPVHKRKNEILGESWYYLSSRGLKVVEMKRGILEENRLSKHELDMERAKKQHFWELAKVYLDLRYKWMNEDSDLKQFHDWDWYPSLAVQDDAETITVRPDAVLRIGEQLFYVELDRSTEPVQRSPFFSDQVSIENKLARYNNVLKISSNKIIREGIIAFVVPDAIYNTRLHNIEKAAKKVFGEKHRVFTGRDIGDIISSYEKLIPTE